MENEVKKFEINTLFNVVEHTYGKESVFMDSASRKLLFEIVDRFKHIKSLDSYDDIYVFYMKQNEDISVYIEEDDVEDFLKANPSAIKNGEEYKVRAEILYKINLGKLNVPRTSMDEGAEQLHYITLNTILPESLNDYLYLGVPQVTLSTKRSAYDNVYPDDNDTNIPWSGVFNIENPLRIIDAFVKENFKDETSVNSYNEVTYQSLPIGEKQYLIKRDQMPKWKYNTEQTAPALEVLKKYIKADKSLYEHDTEEKVTPDVYIKIWNALYAGSHGDLTIGDQNEYFSLHNSKGRELISLVGEYGNLPSTLRKWCECQSMFHCNDVVYARTSLYSECFPMIYSVRTHWHIDAFVEGLTYFDTAVPKLAGAIVVSSTLYDVIEDLYLNRDYIKFSRESEDKYIREERHFIGGNEYQSYSNACITFLEDDDRKLLVENGIEMPWKYKLTWVGRL